MTEMGAKDWPTRANHVPKEEAVGRGEPLELCARIPRLQTLKGCLF